MCRKSGDARVGENRGKRGRKAEAVRKHVLVAFRAELAAEELVAVHYLPDQRLRRGTINIALLNRRASRKPLALLDIAFEPGVLLGIILLHELVAVRAGPVEDIFRMLLENGEVFAQRVWDKFVNDLRVIPAPFSIQVRVADQVQNMLLRQVHGCWGRNGGSGRAFRTFRRW